jgi:hypothetical protein
MRVLQIQSKSYHNHARFNSRRKAGWFREFHDIPYQLSNRVVVESPQGSRILIRADTVKMIEEVADST